MVESEIYEDGAAAAVPRQSPQPHAGLLALGRPAARARALAAHQPDCDALDRRSNQGRARQRGSATLCGCRLAGAVLTALVAGISACHWPICSRAAAFPDAASSPPSSTSRMSVPHTVAGIALLMVFGRRGIIGAPAEALFGLRFWATLAGIVVAMLFVAAPYTVNAARIGLRGDRSAARESGAHVGPGAVATSVSASPCRSPGAASRPGSRSPSPARSANSPRSRSWSITR